MSAVGTGWFETAFSLYKVLGIGLCAALSASTLTTMVGASYLVTPVGATGEVAAAPEEAAPEEEAPEEPPRPGRMAVDRSATIEAIVARGLFCPSCVKAEPKQADGPHSPGTSGAGPMPVAELSEARPCTLPLRLVATMEAGLASRATIRDAEFGSVGAFEQAEFVRPGVSLVSVEHGRVYLRHQNVLEVLYLGADLPPPQKLPAKLPREDKAPVKEALPGMADAVRCESEHACTISRDFVDSLFGNPAKLMGQARVAPAVRDGESRGFEFRGVKRDSLPQVLGISNGDIVTAVNGNNLHSIDQMMGMVTKLRRASNLSITIERKGVAITKEFEIR